MFQEGEEGPWVERIKELRQIASETEACCSQAVVHQVQRSKIQTLPTKKGKGKNRNRKNKQTVSGPVHVSYETVTAKDSPPVTQYLVDGRKILTHQEALTVVNELAIACEKIQKRCPSLTHNIKITRLLRNWIYNQSQNFASGLPWSEDLKVCVNTLGRLSLQQIHFHTCTHQSVLFLKEFEIHEKNEEYYQIPNHSINILVMLSGMLATAPDHLEFLYHLCDSLSPSTFDILLWTFMKNKKSLNYVDTSYLGVIFMVNRLVGMSHEFFQYAESFNDRSLFSSVNLSTFPKRMGHLCNTLLRNSIEILVQFLKDPNVPLNVIEHTWSLATNVVLHSPYESIHPDLAVKIFIHADNIYKRNCEEFMCTHLNILNLINVLLRKDAVNLEWLPTFKSSIKLCPRSQQGIKTSLISLGFSPDKVRAVIEGDVKHFLYYCLPQIQHTLNKLNAGDFEINISPSSILFGIFDIGILFANRWFLEFEDFITILCHVGVVLLRLAPNAESYFFKKYSKVSTALNPITKILEDSIFTKVFEFFMAVTSIIAKDLSNGEIDVEIVENMEEHILCPILKTVSLQLISMKTNSLLWNVLDWITVAVQGGTLFSLFSAETQRILLTVTFSCSTGASMLAETKSRAGRCVAHLCECESVTMDSKLYLEILEVISELIKFNSVQVKAAWSWALSKWSDALVSCYKDQLISSREETIDMAEKLFSLINACCGKDGSLNYSGYRATANLLTWIPEQLIYDSKMKKIVEGITILLGKQIGKGNDFKARWNAAYAIGCCFGNSSIMKTLEKVVLDNSLGPVLSALSKSQNYKERRQCSLAISKLQRGPVMNTSFSSLWKHLCKSLSTLPSDRDEENEDKLKIEIVLTISYLSSIMEPMDIPSVGEVLNSYWDILHSAYSDINGQIREDRFQIVHVGYDRLKALSTVDSSGTITGLLELSGVLLPQ